MSNLNTYQTFIAMSRYARWIESAGRRETWAETCSRYTNYWRDRGKISSMQANTLRQYIENLEVMPSMRALMTAGPALDRDHVAGYNCAYLSLDHPRAFDECMYILLCGTGVGFSCERDEVEKLPVVAEEFHTTDSVIVVPDSKVGWAKSFKQLLAMLWAGEVPSWDVSNVRPAGAKLKTFGGRASGPAPLVSLFEFTVAMFKNAAGRKLTDLEAHDLVCKVAEIVVVGGVRRSALISLSSPTSDRLAQAKSGAWYNTAGHRALANNSACYDKKPDFHFFMNQSKSLFESYSGERGFFNREAAKTVAAKNGRRDIDHKFGCNPCSEILLRPAEFCNLSEVVVRPGDTLPELLDKVDAATIFGTLQASLTDFRYLRKVWKNNCEEEALLGVSLTGIMDHPVLSGSWGDEELIVWLTEMREHAVRVNKKWAKQLKIQPAAAITCVKPSGTVSQLALCSSGIHPAYSRFYTRTVRQDNKDPMTTFLKDQGVPNEPCVMKPDTTTIFSFPIRVADTAVTRDEQDALEQLRLWKIYQEAWCEHKPSITVYYTDDNFLGMMQWVWNNWDIMSGVSMLPYDNGTYQQAPYQQTDSHAYELAVEEFPEVDWSLFPAYEVEDTTTGSQELACSGGVCEIVGSAE